MIITCGLAAVICLGSALRTLYRRELHWKLQVGHQFGLVGMMLLLIAASVAHSATLDMIEVGFAVGFVALSMHVWNVQKRTSADR